jgi:hypothetical protein
MVVRFPTVRAYSGTPFVFFVFFVVNHPLLGSPVLDGAFPAQELQGVLSSQNSAPTNEGVNQSRAEIG